MGFGAVTKVGDVVNPDGLMHGGTRRNLGHLIPTVERLRFACVELKRLHAEINDLHRRMQIAKT
jgi:chromosome segregation ATPase